MKKNCHVTKRILLHGNFVYIDKRIINLIIQLNNKGLTTKYSCSGDKNNEGYIMFDNNIDMRQAYYIIQQYFPKSILILDFDNIIRFYHTKKSWNLYRNRILKYMS